MERFSTIFLVAGLATFLISFALMAVAPMITLGPIPTRTVEEMTQEVSESFYQLAEDYPDEFERHFGEPSPESFAKALRLGKKVYVAEACWHCHSQYVRPVSNEELRFGPVSTADEYKNEMQLPHLFGTRRVGPDLIRQAGRHSNDWHVAHFYEPTWVVPDSVMPSYRWLYDGDRPNERGLALVAYVQWLGSWVERGPETILNVDTIAAP